jgi:hypothetical protein
VQKTAAEPLWWFVTNWAVLLLLLVLLLLSPYRAAAIRAFFLALSAK